LYVFLKVAQNKSITKAAVELHLTQPAVSTIKEFSGSIWISVNGVIGRKLYVTDFGEEIAIAAEKVLNEVEAINYRP
jgi:DNA-binding transcriptional LysR family regulator